MVKMITGEEVIGEVTENISGDIKIENPVLLARTSPKEFGYIPYLPYCDLKAGVTLKPSQVFFITPLQPEFEEAYKSAFSKLLTPPKPTLKLVGV